LRPSRDAAADSPQHPWQQPACGDPQTLLALASEHRSVRTALAALRLAAAAGASARGGCRGRPAGRGVVEALLPAAQQLVLLMVHHGDADVRAAACRALQSVVRCLNPGAVCCATRPRTGKAVSMLTGSGHAEQALSLGCMTLQRALNPCKQCKIFCKRCPVCYHFNTVRCPESALAVADAQMDVLEELLGSPYPSVAAVLLQLLRELVAATVPPPRRALDMAADWLEVCPILHHLAEDVLLEHVRLLFNCHAAWAHTACRVT